MPRRSAPAANDPNVQILRSGGTRSRKLVEKRIVLTTAPKRTKSAKGAKKTKQEKKRGAGKTKNNYLKMVKTAIASNKAHHLHGTTLPAIVKYIQANFQVGVTFRRFVLLTLKKAVAAGQLEKVGARYKFTKAEWRKDHPKKGESASSGSSSKISTEKKSTTTKGRTTTKATAASRKAATETASAAPKKRAPPTQRKTTATTASNEDNVWVWQYRDNGHVWRNYFPAANNVVEVVYQDYLKNPGMTDVRSVQSGQWSYLVDFRQMTQQNVQHEAHTTRPIRRLQVPANEAGDTSKAYQ